MRNCYTCKHSYEITDPYAKPIVNVIMCELSVVSAKETEKCPLDDYNQGKKIKPSDY